MTKKMYLLGLRECSLISDGDGLFQISSAGDKNFLSDIHEASLIYKTGRQIASQINATKADKSKKSEEFRINCWN